jgi:uncharacterized protein (TIGR02996 family)
MSYNLARGFLEDITAHPDDDSPRLIFADWLEEKGDSDRAEFIRVQVERARLPKWDARQVRLWLRERDLLRQHGQKWREELPNLGGIHWMAFRRGFVATANFVNYAVFREKASAYWAATPLETVSVRWPRRNEAVDTIAPIAGLRELSINAGFASRREIDRFAGAPLLSTLRTLNVRNGSLGVEGFRQLTASPYLWNLTALRLPSNSIGNGGISALFDAVALTSLEELDLSEEDNYGRYGEDPIIEATGMELLATWSGMTRLRSLTLSGNNVGREGLRALLRSPRAIGLKELVLRDNGLNGSAMLEFRAAHSKLQLDVLDLGENLLGDLGAAGLASASCLRELKVLNLDRCEIQSSGARGLAKAPFLGSLRRLNVNQNSFGPEGLHALLKKKSRDLHTLQIVNNDLGDKGVARLAESAASDTLLEVNLANNGQGFRAVSALVKSAHLRNLLVLRFTGNLLDKLDATALASSALGKRLAILEISEMPETTGEDIPF